MGFELEDVVNDPDLAEEFTICRSQGGTFGPGGFQDQKTFLPAYGVVSVASDRQIAMLPEADQVNETRVFFNSEPMYTTSENRGAVSDILIWNNTRYRVMSVGKYCNRGGYYMALAVRMQGA